MFNAITECLLRRNGYDDVTDITLTVIGITNTVYVVAVNIVAFVAICLLYGRHLKRTPKLLLSLFATNLLIALAVTSLLVYHLVVEFRQSWFFSAHMSSIVFLILWSSTNVFFVTIDRYLLVVRGRRYLFWKKNFNVFFIVAIISIAGFSVYFYFGLKLMGCTTNAINLTIFSLILLTNLVASSISNAAMMKYLRKNVSGIGSRSNVRNDIAKTVYAMTVTAGFCQSAMVVLMVFYIVTCVVDTPVTEYGNVVLVSFSILVLFKCGTFPLIYVLRNSRITGVLRCRNI